MKSDNHKPQNIWRMKQFYETYTKNEKLSLLVREINWTNKILILNTVALGFNLEAYTRYNMGRSSRKQKAA